MTIKLNKNDRQLLATIAEHRVLTTSQVTAIQPIVRSDTQDGLSHEDEGKKYGHTTESYDGIDLKREKDFSLHCLVCSKAGES